MKIETIVWSSSCMSSLSALWDETEHNMTERERELWLILWIRYVWHMKCSCLCWVYEVSRGQINEDRTCSQSHEWVSAVDHKHVKPVWNQSKRSDLKHNLTPTAAREAEGVLSGYVTRTTDRSNSMKRIMWRWWDSDERSQRYKSACNPL